MGTDCKPCARFWPIGRLEKGYGWLTLMEGDATHDAEWQPTRVLVDDDGTLTAAFEEYIEENGLLSNMQRRTKKL